MAVLAPISGLPRFKNGVLLPAPVAYFYEAGTTTPRTVYQEPSGAAHTQPVAVQGDGNFPAIYVTGTTSYKIRILETDGGSVLAEYDELQAEVAVSSGGGGGTTITTGFEMPAYDTGARAGWVRENGRTIGSGASGATERANDDCEDLFLHLWTVDPNLAVSGGRGATAAADWAANKTIALPDMRGRTFVGLDTMGNVAASRLVGATFSFGDASTLGSYGGVAAQALITANLPSHNHGINDPGHFHGVSDPTHTHVLTDPGHAHNYTDNYFTTGSGAAGGTAAGNAVAAVTTATAVTGITIAANGTGIGIITSVTGISTQNAGSGTAFNLMQPFSLRCIYIKL